ncbi:MULTISPECIES: XTP/dITP diphosphatase [Photorhabdus]|uniref:dITP/XTP pyrophosphatase n=2 Tax=Photorhabdus TaxID=29487 RepID=A0ABX0B826_9GAMM|nr:MULTISPECIES: XTP/dITP diphosphatase [Photorhabdus]MCC8374749.1 XTP/dITP diphosphatase [Photorhabdus bodei]MCC8465676.1 XTP/dITP diphosphatase [Photorhabdus bodei]MCT8352433.1 XTP/dITP diphosphatase [Photorhabdus kayaii]MDB6367101.1 XTP/dITP diphosphatase [Photorhabdus bodei]MDB6370672.1 XTP/dITP diphosphatase [Photorhabdus bodei]
MQKVVLATGNPGKVRELAQLLADFGLNIVAQTELGVNSAEETGLTFIENAILKARHAAQVTGLPAIADDSGLSVDILGGAPGIYSARYAGENATDQQNLEKLLDTMKDIPDDQRQAQFNCVLVYIRHAEDPTPLVFHGRWPGIIAHKPAGNGGFGYDPIFYIPKLGCTAAELTGEQKNAVSHRGQALKMMLDTLRNA